MGGGRREPNHVEQRAAADSDDIGVSVDVMPIDSRLDLGYMEIVVLGAFAALNDKRRTYKVETMCMRGKICFYLFKQGGVRLGEGLIEDDQGFVNRAGFIIDENVFEQRICAAENILSEVHTQSVTDLD